MMFGSVRPSPSQSNASLSMTTALLTPVTTLAPVESLSRLLMENVDAQIRAGPDARRVVGRDCDPHHAAARVRRRAGRDTGVLLQETRGAELGGPAEALREEPVGIPPHRHEPRRSGERGEVGIPDGVRAELEGLAAAAEIPVRDQPAPFEELAVEELIAPFDEVGEEGLRVVGGPAAGHRQRAERKPAPASTPRITGGPRGVARPVDRADVTVRHEMRSEEHTSELQSRPHLVCRLLLE